MKVSSLFTDLAHRPAAAAVEYLPAMSPQVLNSHPGGHPNSPAWLLWHAGREIDVQLAHLTGGEQVWADGWRERIGLGDVGDSFGLGHDRDTAAQITCDDQQVLVDYLTAVCDAVAQYGESLEAEQWEEIIDDSYDPPVTRATRLVSMIDDACQHVGQAAYVAGMQYVD